MNFAESKIGPETGKIYRYSFQNFDQETIVNFNIKMRLFWYTVFVKNMSIKN